ncbi:Ldh family oxidoreductase [Bradyrhizobium tropiciagri]|uniref:Ldh family oxidoreductase n=1 Tax=Bradyrhizobium tropiciagri TaxID=312253 RepID=UPI001BAA2EFB|nr:Ldh family oxidoreductase [Bradyrhizobium tropiciagri]MBR0874927.1 Ldh family oxidoreductase [Bradyrhizobium tropiciagri]
MASNEMHARERLVYVAPAVLKRQIELVLSAWGMTPDKIEVIADLLVETDLRGIESHGASMLPLYDRMRRAGGLNMTPRPRIVKENAATALMDGDAGLGHPVAVEAMNLAVAKCKLIGIGAVSVVNSHHFGATGLYAEMAARKGVIAFVTSSARTVAVLPTGGTTPVLGTNPIAFAAPASRGDPFLLDMSTSAVAANKVKVYAYHQTPLPVGWVVDGAGKPVTDPGEGFRTCMESDVGGLMPMGGTRETGTHKGYGLAVMAQLLGSTLAGGSFSPFRSREAKPGAPDNIGHFFLALDPDFFRASGSFEDDVSDILDHLRATPAVDPDNPVIVAGEPEFARRAERLKTGIPLNDAFLDEVKTVAASAGVDFILDSKVQ